jgi:hypothetical protein
MALAAGIATNVYLPRFGRLPQCKPIKSETWHSG